MNSLADLWTSFLTDLTADEQKFVLISGVFLLYVGTIIVFAIVYFNCFKSTPSSFVFAANIAEGQLANRIDETTKEIKRFDGISGVLASTATALRKQPDRKI